MAKARLAARTFPAIALRLEFLRFENRDLRGHEVDRRQLAVGGSAILFTDRQADGEAPHRDRDSVQEYSL